MGLFLVGGLPCITQSQERETDITPPEPKADRNTLLGPFFEFPTSERDSMLLSQNEVQLVLNIDVYGNPSLKYVMGLEDDSLQTQFATLCRELPRFKPAYQGEEAVAANYYINLNYPLYYARKNQYRKLPHFFKKKEEDFAYINLHHTQQFLGFDALNGGFSGVLGNHLNPGWGFGLRYGMHGKGGWGINLHMQTCFNTVKLPFEINTTRPLDPSVGTLILGLGLERAWKNPASPWKPSMNWDAGYGLLNLATVDNENEDPIQARGFVTGPEFHLVRNVGQMRSSKDYYRLEMLQWQMGFLLGAKAFFLSYDLTGVFYYTGFALGLQTQRVQDFELKKY